MLTPLVRRVSWCVVLGLCCTLAFGADSRGAQLQKLKEQFPDPLTGPVTEKTDSTIRVTYFKYKKMVEALSEDSAPNELAKIREVLDSELYRIELFRDRDDQKSPKTKGARRSNESWLKQKFRPHLARLEMWQRGK